MANSGYDYCSGNDCCSNTQATRRWLFTRDLKPSLDHASIVFRTHRTLQNSLENLIPLLGLVVIALMSEYDSNKLSIIIWMYAISRIIHMILYYKIATKKNPSPRSIFWAIGFLSTFYLMIDLGIFLIF